MPVTTTTEAGRVVASNARANALARAREAADTLTPLDAPLSSVPELFPEDAPPALPSSLVPPSARLVLQTTVQYRGRAITITAQDMKLDAFCDLLDKRLGVAK